MEKGLKLMGARITGISATRNPKFSGKLSMTTNIKITNIEKIKDAKDAIKINYEYTIDYSELGEIKISGILFISSDQKTIKEILKQHKDKNYETPENLALTNLIIQKASIKAIELEDELSLPIHIKLPVLNLKK